MVNIEDQFYNLYRDPRRLWVSLGSLTLGEYEASHVFANKSPPIWWGLVVINMLGRLHWIVDPRLLRFTSLDLAVCVCLKTHDMKQWVCELFYMWLKYDTTKCNITRCMTYTTQCVYGIHPRSISFLLSSFPGLPIDFIAASKQNRLKTDES